MNQSEWRSIYQRIKKSGQNPHRDPRLSNNEYSSPEFPRNFRQDFSHKNYYHSNLNYKPEPYYSKNHDAHYKTDKILRKRSFKESRFVENEEFFEKTHRPIYNKNNNSKERIYDKRVLYNRKNNHKFISAFEPQRIAKNRNEIELSSSNIIFEDNPSDALTNDNIRKNIFKEISNLLEMVNFQKLIMNNQAYQASFEVNLVKLQNRRDLKTKVYFKIQNLSEEARQVHPEKEKILKKSGDQIKRMNSTLKNLQRQEIDCIQKIKKRMKNICKLEEDIKNELHEKNTLKCQWGMNTFDDTKYFKNNKIANKSGKLDEEILGDSNGNVNDNGEREDEEEGNGDEEEDSASSVYGRYEEVNLSQIKQRREQRRHKAEGLKTDPLKTI